MKNQKGFSAVIVLLGLLLVVAVGFTGYFVWNTQNSKKDTAAEVAPATATKPETKQETPAPAKEEQKYLVIKEWGVKIPVSGEISDLSYIYNKSEDTVTLKTEKLSEQQKQLTGLNSVDELGGIGLLSRNNRSYNLELGSAIQNDGPFIGYYIGSTGGYSYVLLPPSQSSCPEGGNSTSYQYCITYENQIVAKIHKIISVAENN